MTTFNNTVILNTLPAFLKSDLEDGPSMVNAREVYAWLEVTEGFATWYNDHITQGNLEGNLICSDIEGIEDDKSSLEYLITRETAQNIAICAAGKKGKYYRIEQSAWGSGANVGAVSTTWHCG